MIIDAHAHVWEMAPEHYPWRPIGGYIPEKAAPVKTLLGLMDASGVEQVVLVQPTPYGWDNTFLLDSVRANPERLKAVILVDPHSASSSDELERLVREEQASGVRFNWNLEPAFPWDANPFHVRIWNSVQQLNLPVCLQVTNAQLGMVSEMAGQFPGVRVILDHLGRPNPGSQPRSSDFERLLALTGCPNVFVKLSGLYYYSQQNSPFTDTWTLVQAAVRSFGPQRCLWGSDYPFILDRWCYAELLEVFREKLSFGIEEQEWVLGRTASSLGW